MPDFYDWLALELAGPDCQFLNYGYIDPERGVGRDVDWQNGDSLHEHLLHRVLSEVALYDQKVLDVGCGRGGNGAWIRDTFAPALMVGLDLCLPSLVFCADSGLERDHRFAAGDAHTLPFADASFDVVLNLESSHCYADMYAFISEVIRVLKPGGTFCWADIWDLEILGLDWKARGHALLETGLELMAQHDLSEGVFLALKDPRGLPARLLQMATGDNQPVVASLVHNLETFRLHLAAGRCEYRMMQLRKT